MQNVLIALHLIIVIAMIGTILIQRSEGGGLGLGGGDNFMKSRPKINFLTRTTTYLAIGFFLTTIALTVVSRNVVSQGDTTLQLPGFEDELTLPGEALSDDDEEIALPDLGEPEADAPAGDAAPESAEPAAEETAEPAN